MQIENLPQWRASALDQPAEIARLLRAWAGGNQATLYQLAPMVYRELRDRAHAYMRHERRAVTFQTTVLVNEAWLRIVDVSHVDWRHRVHFFASPRR
jgi:ECF sigma factor